MAKWWKWLTNPVGAIVNDITRDSKDGTLGHAINGIINPVDTIIRDNSDGEYRDIGDIINKKVVDPLYNYFTEGEGADAVSKLWNEITGERDTEENEKNRGFQKSEAEIARDWEAEQAQLAREWDSIGSQMERANAVGVNPISIAMQNGGINSSATTSIPSSTGIPSGSSSLMHNGILDIASTVFNGIGTLAESRLKQSQSDDIVIMRKFNIAEKIANTDHIRKLCQGVDLSNVAQTIQNRWLDVMNQATYDGMLLENGVKRSTILEKRSIAKLNLSQVSSIRQQMELDLKKFNATLPLELQLMEEELNLKKISVQDVYTEICMRHLQAIEQENRNRQSAAEAGQAEVSEYIAKQTYEDAIASFHNDMVKSAAEAGVSLYDYQYYGTNYKGFFDWMSKTQRLLPGTKKIRKKVQDFQDSTIYFPQNLGEY